MPEPVDLAGESYDDALQRTVSLAPYLRMSRLESEERRGADPARSGGERAVPRAPVASRAREPEPQSPLMPFV